MPTYRITWYSRDSVTADSTSVDVEGDTVSHNIGTESMLAGDFADSGAVTDIVVYEDGELKTAQRFPSDYCVAIDRIEPGSDGDGDDDTEE